ncbi:MAG: aminopeptidase N [Sphingomonadaceae bacterium]|nr:aminopeptidase N [Sphingomonadaceae bacterium]
MDIATPPQPDGTTVLADAAPTPHEPPLIRREDYRPFAWLVPEVSLDFALGIDRTRVRSRLTVQRNAKADHADTIRLNGDGLAALSVTVDGAPCDWSMDGGDLMVPLHGDSHLIAVETEIDPSANTQLMGLYASNGMLCTQCEAEGFRRITFFPDRPDVLSVYSVRMAGPKAQFPVLLCNGNEVATGEGADGSHWAQWHDPWPKPSYLFALVAGDLVANTRRFTTMGGREVTLNVWVREADLDRTGHALESLAKSMAWDEQVFGREYDLDLYNVVAVSDFNMGAMENKGLNVFNTKYVLADQDTATDADYDAIEGVIAHEYFHNWSGNRVTCRDWFQLSLKEGFTVLRDQLFSQDMQGEAVKRIEDVRVLRAAQFPEDSGPLAHPIRPDSFREISNFYTATVYNKGAEVIRMMRTMAGPERFRKGCDLYFKRHDGQAATCEDFILAMERGAGLDLGNFRKWYSTAGTPIVRIERVHIPRDHEDELVFTQWLRRPDGSEVPASFTIPLLIRPFDSFESRWLEPEQLVVLDAPHTVIKVDNRIGALSVNRGFTAPVIIEREIRATELLTLAAHDDDPFARYEAMQELVVGHLTAASGGGLDDSARAAGQEAIRTAFAAVLADTALDDSMRGELLALPGHGYLAEQQLVADPARIHAEREGLKAWLGRELEAELFAHHQRVAARPFTLDSAGKGARKVRMQTLVYLAAGNPDLAAGLAAAQYDSATNMTDRQGALTVLAGLQKPERTARLIDFYNRFRGNDLVIDKWFSLQALSLHPHALEHVKALADHPDFTLRNPNRVRALYMAFAANPHAFHAADGEGYRLLADVILALDPVNAQTAARMVPYLGRWRRTEPGRAALMKAELERILAHGGLSRDTFEQVSRSLG